MTRQVHVAVGVITNGQGEILIALRPEHTHQGGLWEFPGGKVDAGETLSQALARELDEELSIQVTASEPLIRIAHDYGDKSVLLDVHRITAFTGEPEGREGQPIRWVSVNALNQYDFPAANKPIIQALRLPDRLLITGDAPSAEHAFQAVESALQQGVRLIQWRAHNLPPEQYTTLSSRLGALCHNAGAQLQCNTSPERFVAERFVADSPGVGLHLNRWALMACTERPVPENILLGASCHSEVELAQARRLGVDYVCLSPVAPTPSHPEAEVLGWQQFQALAAKAGAPVYALGGMTVADIPQAKAMGGQGIAGIRFAWPY